MGGALGVAQATESWKLTHCSKHLAMGGGKDRIDRERNSSIDHPAEPFLQRCPWLDFLGLGLQRPAGRQYVRWWVAGGYLETRFITTSRGIDSSPPRECDRQ